MSAPRCDKCGKQKGAQSYYKCPKCGHIYCSGCVGGVFSGTCPNEKCQATITKQDKIN